MSVAHSYTAPASPFETSGNVVELRPESPIEVCIRQYEKMVSDFKDLLIACNGGVPKPDCFECPPVIVLSRYEDGKVATNANIHSISCAYGPSKFMEADGFKIYKTRYYWDRGESDSEYIPLSLVERGSNDEILYPNRYQSDDQVARTQDWLNNNLPVGDRLLCELWSAAADPYLNPKMAKAIRSTTSDSQVATEAPGLSVA